MEWKQERETPDGIITAPVPMPVLATMLPQWNMPGGRRPWNQITWSTGLWSISWKGMETGISRDREIMKALMRQAETGA